MTALVDGYDTALFDLDGVIYLGPSAVDGAAEGVAALRERGVRIGYVTNNAARPPRVVVDQLNSLGVSAELGDVVTSAQAGARMLAENLPAGSKVLILGTDALAAEVRAVGLEPVSSSTDAPVAVIQGYHPSLPWSLFDQGFLAIQNGAAWYVTNSDSTRPTDHGLVAGAGAQIAALKFLTKLDPPEAGKPCPPLLHETVRRLDAKRPIFVGDRIDTDVMGANAVEMDSLLVFTGAHGKHDLWVAPANGRPTAIGYDLRALLAPARVAEVTDSGVRCGAVEVSLVDGVPKVTSEVPADLEGQLDGVWAALQLAWRHPGLDPAVLDVFDQVP